MRIGQVALLVRDYDEAIAWFTTKLNFELVEDTALSDKKRWVVVQPLGGEGASLLLAKAKNAQQDAFVGDQTGGRVFLFIYTQNFDRDYDTMKKRGVEFIENPRAEEFGKVVVFKDLYGNKWDMVERHP